MNPWEKYQSLAQPSNSDGYMEGEARTDAEFEQQWAEAMDNAPQDSEIVRANKKIEATKPQPVVESAKPWERYSESTPVSYESLNTKLLPQEESNFQNWKKQYAPHDSGEDYDLRGAFKKGLIPSDGHFSDEFKKPNHPTFSNQSKFAKDYPDKAGHWAGKWDEKTREYTPPEGEDIYTPASRAYEQNSFYKPKQKKEYSDNPLNPAFYNDMSLINVPQNLGNLVAGGVRGAGSIGSSILLPIDAAKAAIAGTGITGAQENNSNRREGIDAGLKTMGADPTSGLYKTGKLGAEIAGTADVGGVLAIGAKALNMHKTANALKSMGFSLGGKPAEAFTKQGLANAGIRVAGAGTAGAVAGGTIDPQSAVSSGLISAAFPILGKVGGEIGVTLRGGEVDDLAKVAIDKYHIPLDKATASNSKMIKATKSVLDDALIGGFGKKQKELAQQAFNREVGNVFDAGAPKLTDDVMKQAKSKISTAYDKVWNKNKFVLDRQYADEATSLIQDASNKLNPEQANTISRYFDYLTSKAKNGEIDGDFVNNWQSELRKMAEGDNGLSASVMGKLRSITLDAFKRNISKADADLLTKTNIKNRAFKTLEPIMNKVEAGVGGRDVGDVPAALFSSSVAKNYNDAANSPFGDLPLIGSKYFVDRVARTGGSERALIQNATTAMLGAGAYGVGTGAISPVAVAALPLLYGAQKGLSLPANSNVSDAVIRKLLLKGAQRAAPALVNQN